MKKKGQSKIHTGVRDAQPASRFLRSLRSGSTGSLIDSVKGEI